MTITDKAKNYIQELMSENGAKNIKVFVAGMGWGGPQLGLALDEPGETDIVEEVNGIQVAYEQNVHGQTSEMALDYQDTPQGAGLVMTGNESSCWVANKV